MGHFKKLKQAGFFGIDEWWVMSSDLLPVDVDRSSNCCGRIYIPDSCIQGATRAIVGCSPSEKPGSGLGFSFAAGRVPTGLVAAPTTPSMERQPRYDGFSKCVSNNGGGPEWCKTCVEISLGCFGGVTLGNFPVKMTSIYFKIDSTYLYSCIVTDQVAIISST